MAKTFSLPSGSKFSTASARRFVLVYEGRERLEIDRDASVCPRCGAPVVRGLGAHWSSADSDACFVMGASRGVEIVKRSDSLDVLRRAAKGAAYSIVDTDSGEIVR